MKFLFACILSSVFYVTMGLLLVIFHPVQVIAYNFFGYPAHKKTVDFLNFLLIINLYTLLCRPSFRGFTGLPVNKPLIIVSNHQSMFDISPVVWGFRKHHAKFISKKELGRNIPSISYNLKKGGSVLIDRKNHSQSIREIFKLGRLMEERNYSACLFPEGTRSRTGKIRAFQAGGFKALLKASPSAIVVPFVINGNYKLHKYGLFPLDILIKLEYTALEPVSRGELNDEDLLQLIENRIRESLNN